jgi:hypothetical protein
MYKTNRRYISLFLMLLLIIAMLSRQTIARANTMKRDQASSHQQSSAKAITGHMLTMHTLDMRRVPGTTFSPSATTTSNSNTDRQKVSTPLQVAPINKHPQQLLQSGGPTNISRTPPLATSFQGLVETYCGTKTCPPPDPAPDMALGTSPNWVLQGTNRWFSVYNPLGTLQHGWPKTFQNFFGIPYPSGCTAVPDSHDPRAFYDPNDQRFWAEVINNEVPHAKCTSTYSQVWIAVSQTNNPNGIWNVYSFDLMLGSQNFGDFSQFGYDQQAIYFSCDMFNQNDGLGTFEYEEVLSFNKAAMEAGQNVTPYGFTNLMSAGVEANGVQPVEVEAYKYMGPDAGLFVSSFDYESGGGNCIQGCSGLTVWAIANPGTPSATLSSLQVSSSSYAQAPNADETGCSGCLESADPGISGTPVWRNGQITFSLETAVNNGSQLVAGIFWGQINVTLNSSGTLTGANVSLSGYYSFSGDTSLLTSTVMPDNNGNLVMVFTASSNSIYPGAYYAVKPVNDSYFPDGGLPLMQGQATTPIPRWGDYSAVSTIGVGAASAWIAGEYEAADQSWSTYIGKVYTGS